MMTTVAYRDGVMAANTATWLGDAMMGESSHVVILRGHLVGCAGGPSACHIFRDWFEAGVGRTTLPEIPSEGYEANFDALTVSPGGVVSAWDRNFSPMPIRAEYHAIGSGMCFALGAMATGSNASGAVFAAAKHDAYTRGSVETITLPDLRVPK